jgi:hypothetical protein
MRRSLLAAAILVASAGSAMAQITEPVTFNVFGRANRQPGTYQSASAEIPLGLNAIGVSDTMTDQDASDPANSFILWTEISQDGVNWTPFGFREEWHGGLVFDKRVQALVPNHIRTAWTNTDVQNGVYVGWRVRLVVDQAVTMRVGFDIKAYPTGFDPD